MFRGPSLAAPNSFSLPIAKKLYKFKFVPSPLHYLKGEIMCHNWAGTETKAIPQDCNIYERKTVKAILANTNMKSHMDFCKFDINCLQMKI